MNNNERRGWTILIIATILFIAYWLLAFYIPITKGQADFFNLPNVPSNLTNLTNIIQGVGK